MGQCGIWLGETHGPGCVQVLFPRLSVHSFQGANLTPPPPLVAETDMLLLHFLGTMSCYWVVVGVKVMPT